MARRTPRVDRSGAGSRGLPPDLSVALGMGLQTGSAHRELPFFALSEQQVPARRSKGPHKAKVQNRSTSTD